MIGLAVLLTAGVDLAVRYRKLYAPPVLALPADDEVLAMRASFRRAPGGKAVPPFLVPADHVPRILKWLRPGEYVREPLPLGPLDEWGEVSIRTKAGRELWLWLYSAGRGPAVIVCDPDGRDQFHGRRADGVGGPADGGLRLRKAVEEAFEFQQRRSLQPR